VRGYLQKFGCWQLVAGLPNIRTPVPVGPWSGCIYNHSFAANKVVTFVFGSRFTDVECQTPFLEALDDPGGRVCLSGLKTDAG